MRSRTHLVSLVRRLQPTTLSRHLLPNPNSLNPISQLRLFASGTVGNKTSTVVTVEDTPGTKVPLNWTPVDLQAFLLAKKYEYQINDEDIDAIYTQRVAGRDFIGLTAKKLANDFKLPLGPAMRIKELIDTLKKPQVIIPHNRDQRWNALNAVLEKNKSRKKRSYSVDCENEDLDANGISTGYSYTGTSWLEVSPIFDQIRRPYLQEVKMIPEEDYKVLSKMLSWIVKCYHSSLFDGKDNEAKRIHLIAPVLWAVVQLLPDVTVNVKQDLSGKRIHAHSHFEFILTRGHKRLCIVEAKEEKFRQGLAQNLVGCEVAADLDDAHEVYGIVTNFVQWIFLKSLDEEILCDEFNVLTFDGEGTPVRDQLMQVVGKIYSLLC
ncbi:hypothetical protein DFH27DRAFT_540495 [Peziza echinospora]|nr:hypothetical protein DFH27DRAFT_540495 [Peziza echinospora]